MKEFGAFVVFVLMFATIGSVSTMGFWLTESNYGKEAIQAIAQCEAELPRNQTCRACPDHDRAHGRDGGPVSVRQFPASCFRWEKDRRRTREATLHGWGKAAPLSGKIRRNPDYSISC